MALAGLLFTGTGLYCRKDNIETMLAKFGEGKVCESCLPSPGWNIERPEVLQKITEILQPQGEGRSFYFITGDVGSGKTVAIQQAMAQMKEPRGVVYYYADLGEDLDSLARNLSRATGYDPLDWVPSSSVIFRSGEVEASDWSEFSAALEAAAREFKQRHGRPLVLVRDTLDYIVKRRDRPAGC